MSGQILVDSGAMMQVQANDVEAMGDGGRVVLVGDSTMLPKRLYNQEMITNVTTVINYREDEPMYSFPSLRLSQESRRFRVLVMEGVSDEDLEAIRELLEQRAGAAA